MDSRHRVTRATKLGLWVATVIVGVGCSGPSDGSSDGPGPGPQFSDHGGELADLAEGEPIAAPGDYVDAPAAPTGAPRLEVARELSTAGGSRADAEAFAVEFLHLIADTRDEMDVDEMVDDLVAEDADPNTVAYLATNLALTKGSEVRQIWRTDEESWIRTQVRGDPERPDPVSIEVAFTLGLDQDTFRSWVTYRIELVRPADAWLVTEVTFRSLDYMPADGASISQALDGQGWRAITSA